MAQPNGSIYNDATDYVETSTEIKNVAPEAELSQQELNELNVQLVCTIGVFQILHHSTLSSTLLCITPQLHLRAFSFTQYCYLFSCLHH